MLDSLLVLLVNVLKVGLLILLDTLLDIGFLLFTHQILIVVADSLAHFVHLGLDTLASYGHFLLTSLFFLECQSHV